MQKIVRWTADVAAAALLIVAVASPAQASPTVRALWNMAAVPTMADSAGGDNNGRTTAVTMRQGFYDFNGATSIAQVPHKANLNPGTADIRLETRVYIDSAPAPGETYDLLRKGISSTSGGYYKIELRGKVGGGVTVACIFKDGNRVAGITIGSVPTAAWVTITCTKTAKSVTLVAAGRTWTTARTVGAISNSSAVHLGGKGDGSDVFDGLMDYASIAIG